MMRLQEGFPKKFVDGEAVCEKRYPALVTRVERTVHDWLYENTGRYPLIHYFDAQGRFTAFVSYLSFEKKVGRADDHDEEEDQLAARRAARIAKLKSAWRRPETRRRHAEAYERGGRRKFSKAMKKLLAQKKGGSK